MAWQVRHFPKPCTRFRNHSNFTEITVISAISFLLVSRNYMEIFGILRISIHFAISVISTVISVISDRVYEISEVADPSVGLEENYTILNSEEYT